MKEMARLMKMYLTQPFRMNLQHQFDVNSDHVDSNDSTIGNVLNHMGNDQCTMSYLSGNKDGNIEFDDLCIYQIRDKIDPILNFK